MENRDDQLWRVAKKRAGFKVHLFIYIVINAFFWVLWAMTKNEYGHGTYNIWPIWPMFGWGIGLLFSYFDAYQKHGGNSMVEREYEKLKKERNENQLP